MIKIGIELNGVIRNVNKQILKYYQKDIDPTLDLDDIDEKDDVFKYAKFESKKDKNEFIYIDYPYEIFGCAKTMDKELPTEINNWLNKLVEYEKEDIEVSFFSLNEEFLTIQSSFFFLSKIGSRVRKVYFPKTADCIKNEYDVIIGASKDIVNWRNNSNYLILINNNTNSECKESVDKNYDSVIEFIKDENVLDEIVDRKNSNDTDE